MAPRDPAPRPRARPASGPRDGPDRLRAAYDRVHARLWRALLSWSGRHDLADEAAAEAFAQAARRLDRIRDVDAWVWRAAFRIAAGELHSRSRRDLPVGSAADVLTDAAAYRRDAVHVDLPQVGTDLVRALGQLTDQQRACVVLRDVAGLSAHQAAAVLGTTQATVRVQALRGRSKLRELLETNHD